MICGYVQISVSYSEYNLKLLHRIQSSHAIVVFKLLSRNFCQSYLSQIYVAWADSESPRRSSSSKYIDYYICIYIYIYSVINTLYCYNHFIYLYDMYNFIICVYMCIYIYIYVYMYIYIYTYITIQVFFFLLFSLSVYIYILLLSLLILLYCFRFYLT